jgi:hypothetical protein
MNRRYVPAVVVAAAGSAAAIWSILLPAVAAEVVLLIGSAAVPVAVLLAVAARLEEGIPWRAVFGGGLIGGAVALASHGLVFAFAYAFFLGFAEAAVDLLDALRVDPRVTSLAGSPWTIVAAVELVVVAPLTEEVGKFLGARVARAFDTRRVVFLAGVAAGSAFAVIENVLYASGAGFFGESWQFIVVARTLGAAVHPLATGLVALAWWDWRHTRDRSVALRRFFAGVGVHALWNGSLVVLQVVATAFDIGGTPREYTVVSLSYSAVVGLVVAGGLWRATNAVAAARSRVVAFDGGDGRLLGAWTVLAASFLVPVAMLLLGVM